MKATPVDSLTALMQICWAWSLTTAGKRRRDSETERGVEQMLPGEEMSFFYQGYRKFKMTRYIYLSLFAPKPFLLFSSTSQNRLTLITCISIDFPFLPPH